MSDRLRMNVLVAARDEYSHQLINLVLPHMRDLFQCMFDKIKDNTTISTSKKFYKFQEELKKTPQWNSLQIENVSDKIIKDLPYLIDLVTAVFVTNVKILACVRIGGDSKNLNVKIPSKETFIHKLIVECAENIYYDPMIFDYRGSYHLLQERKNQINKLLDQSIKECISKLLPINDILKENLIGSLDDIDNNIDSEEESDDDNEIQEDINDNKECEIESDDESENKFGDNVSEEDAESDDDDEPEIKRVTINNPKNGFSSGKEAFLPDPPDDPQPTTAPTPPPTPTPNNEDLF